MRRLLLSLLLLAACGGEVEPSRIAAARRQAEVEAKDGQPARAAQRYTKRDGLHIDLPYLLGRRLGEIEPAAIADQLGEELGRQELPESEAFVQFSKADAWLYDGRLYRIRKRLAHTMDVPTALGTSGFPLRIGNPIESTNELRWNNVWNMRRIRLMKSEEDDRLYVQIDVAKFLPKELN